MTTALAAGATPGLLRIEAIRQMLADCVRVDEVKDIHDKAAAIAAYYRQRGATLEVQNDAAEIRLRAERRLGELLKEMPKNKGALKRGPAVPEEDRGETLADIGITKKQSSVWQRIAALAENEFEDRIAESKENSVELTTSRVLRGPPPADIKPPSRPDAPTTSNGAPNLSTPEARAGALHEALRPLKDLLMDWPDDTTAEDAVRELRSLLESWEHVHAKAAAR